MTIKTGLKTLAVTGVLSILIGCAPTNDNGPEQEPTETEPTNQSDDPLDEDSQTDDFNEDSSRDTGEEEDVEDDNVTLDLEEDIFNPSSTAVLVNKSYSLNEEDAPDDLVLVDVPTVLESVEIRQMRQVAADALKEMFSAAEEEGIILHARSGYRSYQTQVQLFNNYVENHGEEAANRYSARPGESEHQTGLAMDVTSESVNYQLTEAFGETEEGIWVKENAHDYGFIIRYPEGKEAITGYIYEPWHLRYLGKDLATDVHESGLTYEEYLAEGGLDIEINE
ncbi:LD-carboxypeptidase LdcB [Alkalibacterium iburiense]|uniref:LD-carboxypeptidase LdcB n=1 Tax=Alkalibacterium iburiense TaxID=290589 RepID=A0ABN0X012_9LACT